MSSFDTTPLNVYLIGFFSLALIAVAFAIGVAAYELVRHRRLRLGRTEIPSAAFRSTSPPNVDAPADSHGSKDEGGKLAHTGVSAP